MGSCSPVPSNNRGHGGQRSENNVHTHNVSKGNQGGFPLIEMVGEGAGIDTVRLCIVDGELVQTGRWLRSTNRWPANGVLHTAWLVFGRLHLPQLQ